MAKTIITFKALSDHRIIKKDIPIEHSFQVIPATVFNGVELPATSIESQVIDYLDSIDKRDLMVEHDFDMILDYWPKRTRRKRDEVAEFIEYCKPYIQRFPTLKRPIGAIIHESRGVLFGKNKSNETKFKEVLNMLNVTNKVIAGVCDIIDGILKSDNNKQLESNKYERDNEKGCKA